MEDDKWCVIEENNNKYPCAEWWKYQDDDHCCLPFYPTPILLGCILTFIKDDHKYYERSLKMGEKLMLDYLKYNISDKNDLHAMSILLKGLKKIGRVDNLYEEVHEKWLRDLDYALTRQKERYPYNEACLLYEIVSDDLLLDGKFKDLIIEHGQFLIDSRQTTGLWIPNWNWGNDDSYWDIASILWCSVLAVRNLLFLKNFNLIEEGAFDE